MPQASRQGPCRYALHESPGNHQGPEGDHFWVNTHFIDVETEAHRAQDTACSLEQSQTTGHTCNYILMYANICFLCEKKD